MHATIELLNKDYKCIMCGSLKNSKWSSFAGNYMHNHYFFYICNNCGCKHAIYSLNLHNSLEFKVKIGLNGIDVKLDKKSLVKTTLLTSASKQEKSCCFQILHCPNLQCSNLKKGIDLNWQKTVIKNSKLRFWICPECKIMFHIFTPHYPIIEHLSKELTHDCSPSCDQERHVEQHSKKSKSFFAFT